MFNHYLIIQLKLLFLFQKPCQVREAGLKRGKGNKDIEKKRKGLKLAHVVKKRSQNVMKKKQIGKE